jgi:CubicO group peptidase (beta-lactamase class C family)
MKKMICFLLLFSASSAGYAQDKAALRIEQLMRETPVMGLSVAVIKNNKPVYVKAFGLKNAATNEKLDTTDIFRIASISKSFVATAVMQLVEK